MIICGSFHDIDGGTRSTADWTIKYISEWAVHVPCEKCMESVIQRNISLVKKIRK